MSFRTVASLLVGLSLSGPACGGDSMFAPPPHLVGELGDLRSPLRFNDGRPVETPAQWERRREEIRRDWDRLMGPWPPVIELPRVETLGTSQQDGYEQRRVRFELAPDHPTEGYLLIPPGDGPRPAALVVYYEPETAIGEGTPHRDFARQLARRGFVTLSVGHQPSLYYPSRDDAQLQPLSALAYGAANAYHVLAAQPEVDADRVAVVGHSYGGKWALFAACLYEKFACGVWSDPGVVFDETRPSVNYWEPWYLGYEPAPAPADGADAPAADVPPQHRRWGAGRVRAASGPPTPEDPAFGAYPELVRQGRNLHELHALMAPRPFLVSGGAEDPPERWRALNHSVAVNRLLGYENRVAMTNRAEHAPNETSNAQIAAFLERFLKPAAGD
ncbi:dienelactone hydrolase family protein [Alienimonas californiensis]|uniref:Alpha/beta hydrolase family protein n=1 Tax=Alienimonas californiensis TaxID=2527989 RepID=A0A517PFG3_9PLAN|nr:prolyl oligopeptidase family serine peptidase [Alienimonas californiensis]QDT18116.1 Alpha/beta hydrolase family protein [Alienimonas californiensis]